MKETIGLAVVGSFAFVVSRAIALLFATSAFGLTLFISLFCSRSRPSLAVCMRFASTYRGAIYKCIHYRIIAIQFSICGCNRNTTEFEFFMCSLPEVEVSTHSHSHSVSRLYVWPLWQNAKKALSSKSARVLRLVYQVALKCSPDKPKKRGALIQFNHSVVVCFFYFFFSSRIFIFVLFSFAINAIFFLFLLA